MRSQLWIAPFLLCLVACGGPPICPVAAPADRSSCEDRGFVCEAGGSAHKRCSTVAICASALDPQDPEAIVWTVSAPATACTQQNDAACPSNFDSVPTATACGTTGLSCDYSVGRCDCLPCSPSGLNWRCRRWEIGLEARCPTERPQMGSACEVPNLLCRYDDACTVSFGPDLICLNERWQPRTGARRTCAVPTCGVDQ